MKRHEAREILIKELEKKLHAFHEAEEQDFVYVSGPMTGYPEHNFPAFHEMTEKLRSKGYLVFNPAENDGGSRDKTWQFYMKIDVIAVALSDFLVLLPGWESSKGATQEIANAHRLGIPCYEYFPSTGGISAEPLDIDVEITIKRKVKSNG